jgi:hypothetical protein
MWREDWKGLSKNVSGTVYMISSFGDPLKYYDPKIDIVDIRQISPNPSLTRGGLQKTITVIPYGEEIHGVDHNNILEKAGYDKMAETDFRAGVSLEKWEKMGTK